MDSSNTDAVALEGADGFTLRITTRFGRAGYEVLNPQGEAVAVIWVHEPSINGYTWDTPAHTSATIHELNGSATRAVSLALAIAADAVDKLNEANAEKLAEAERRRREYAEEQERIRAERQAKREAFQAARKERAQQNKEALQWHLEENFRMRRTDDNGQMMRATVFGKVRRVTDHDIQTISEKGKYMSIPLANVISFEIRDPDNPRKFNPVISHETGVVRA